MAYSEYLPDEALPSIRKRGSRVRCPLYFELRTRTLNSMVDETDVNNIVERYRRTGIMPPSDRTPVFADVTGLQVDLTESINHSNRVMADMASNDQELRIQRERSLRESEEKLKSAAKDENDSQVT